MKIKVAILAGGLATRLHPVSLQVPKSMILINGYPFIGWQLKLLANSGMNSVVLCLGYRASEIMEFVGDGQRFGLEVTYSIEETPLGTGGALKKAEPILGDVFGVLYGDSYLPINYKKVVEKFFEVETHALMTVYKNENKHDQSNIIYFPNQPLLYLKGDKRPDLNCIDYGFIMFNKSALSAIPKNTQFDLSNLLIEMSLKGQIKGYEIMERFYEIGSFGGIVDLETYLKEQSK